ncbi:MAG: bifunctional DNA primase/polymerase [Polyangiaceae bacterium]
MTAPLDAPVVPPPHAQPPPAAPGNAPRTPDGFPPPEAVPAGGPSTGAMLDAALAYASLGWPVMPLYEPVDVGVCSCSRGAACRDAGKHPRLSNGVSGASTDGATVRAWWSTWPSANVGIRCDSLAVVDIDPRNGGSLEQLVAEHGSLPPTPQAATGGGGVHLFFRRPPGELRGKLGPGIDLQRGDGAQVVAWPSRHKSGGQYAWCPAPWETAVAEMPPSLVALARQGPARGGAAGAASPGPRGGSTGGRAQPDRSANDFAIALRLLNDGADDAEVFAEIVSKSDKYRERAERSESAAREYAKGTVENARRVHEASPVRRSTTAGGQRSGICHEGRSERTLDRQDYTVGPLPP